MSTLVLEPLALLKVKFPGGQIRELSPGRPIELPDDQARRLLAKAPGRVRVAGPERPLPGDLLWWTDPRDGTERGPALCRGTFDDGCQTWCWFRFGQEEHLLNCALIVRRQ